MTLLGFQLHRPKVLLLKDKLKEIAKSMFIPFGNCEETWAIKE